jgi:hypothetical protein
MFNPILLSVINVSDAIQIARASVKSSGDDELIRGLQKLGEEARRLVALATRRALEVGDDQ